MDAYTVLATVVVFAAIVTVVWLTAKDVARNEEELTAYREELRKREESKKLRDRIDDAASGGGLSGDDADPDGVQLPDEYYRD